MRRSIPIMALCLCVTAFGAGGCNILAFFGYLFAPDVSEKTIDAEFDGLRGKTVAVVVFADPSVQYDYPQARFDLTMSISDTLEKHVKSARLIAPARVNKYQDEHLGWESQPRTQIGAALGADYVLYVSLLEFSTREPGSVHLYRGHVKAQAAVYDCSKSGPAARVWTADSIDVVHPAQSAVGIVGEDDRTIRVEAQNLFAQTLVKKFYKHKEKAP